MQNMPSENRRSSAVMATFEDGLSTFLLSCDATFEDIAGRLGQIAERHQGRPYRHQREIGLSPTRQVGGAPVSSRTERGRS